MKTLKECLNETNGMLVGIGIHHSKTLRDAHISCFYPKEWSKINKHFLSLPATIRKSEDESMYFATVYLYEEEK